MIPCAFSSGGARRTPTQSSMPQFKYPLFEEACPDPSRSPLRITITSSASIMAPSTTSSSSVLPQTQRPKMQRTRAVCSADPGEHRESFRGHREEPRSSGLETQPWCPPRDPRQVTSSLWAPRPHSLVTRLSPWPTAESRTEFRRWGTGCVQGEEGGGLAARGHGLSHQL